MRLRLSFFLAATVALCAGSAGLAPQLGSSAGAATPPPSALRLNSGGPAERTGDVIVHFRANATLSGVAGAIGSASAQAKASGAGGGLVLVHPNAGQSVDAAVAALQGDPSVDYAEADVVVKAALTPNDTYYGAYQWNLPQIGGPAAWDVTTGNTGVVVAVIDTGVDGTQPDLSGKLIAGKNMINLGVASSSNSSGTVKVTTTTAHPYLSGQQVAIAGHSVGAVNNTWTIFVPRSNIASSTNAGGLVKITTSGAHGLATGEQAMISGHDNGCTDPSPAVCPPVNGTWQVTVVDATSFTLNTSTWSGHAGGATGAAKEASWFTLTGSSYSSAGTGGTANEVSAKDDHSHGTFVAGIIGANTNNASGMAGVCWLCKIMPVKVLDNTGSGSTYDVAAGINWAVANGADVINLSLGAPSGIASLQTAVDAAWTAGVIVVAASGNDNGPVLFPAAYPNAVAVGANNSAGARSSFSNYGPELDVMAPGESVLSVLCACNGMGGGYGTGDGTSFASPHVAGVVGLMIAAGITDKNTIRTRLTSTATDMGAAGFDNLTGYGRVNAALDVAPPDTTGPAVSITAPSNGASVTGSVSFNATASDPSGVSKVRFWVDATYLGYDSAAPYSKTWDTSLSSAGTHTLKAEAFDGLGNVSSTTISVTVLGGDTTPPAASITAPANGATVSGSSVAFTANASDAGGISKVRFWVDTTYLGFDSAAPYAKTWNTTGFTDGAHTLKVEAFDNASNLTTVTISVTVANTDPTPPTVALTAPANGATVAGTLNITATAADNVGVQKVRFWVDSTYLGYDSTASYAMSWNSTGVANGAHTLKVQSVDAAGNLSTLATVTVTVSN